MILCVSKYFFESRKKKFYFWKIKALFKPFSYVFLKIRRVVWVQPEHNQYLNYKN